MSEDSKVTPPAAPTSARANKSASSKHVKRADLAATSVEEVLTAWGLDPRTKHPVHRLRAEEFFRALTIKRTQNG